MDADGPCKAQTLDKRKIIYNFQKEDKRKSLKTNNISPFVKFDRENSVSTFFQTNFN